MSNPVFGRRTVLRVVAPVLVALASVLVLTVAAGAATTTVAVKDNAFDPNAVTIFVGDTVEWRFPGANGHSVTSPGLFDSHPSCQLTPETGCSTKGQNAYTYTFTAAGEFQYFCKVHVASDDMRGTITVVEPGPTPTDEPTPLPTKLPTELPTETEAPSPSPSPTPPPKPTPKPTQPPNPVPTPSETDDPRPAQNDPPPPPPRRAEQPPFPTATELTSPQATALTPFPEPPDLDGTRDEVAVALNSTDPSQRRIAFALAVGGVLFSIGAFAKYVLFGPPWAT